MWTVTKLARTSSEYCIMQAEGALQRDAKISV